MRIFYTDGSCSPNPGPGGFAVISCSQCEADAVSEAARKPISGFSSLDVSSDMSQSDKTTSDTPGSTSEHEPSSHKEHVYKPVVLGSEKESTNIRMEGEALIAAMKYSKGQECEIHTDSEFWIKVITIWAPGWKEKGWKKSSKGEIQNLDLVKEACEQHEKSKAKLVWVKAHDGHNGNEQADEWANKAREGYKL